MDAAQLVADPTFPPLLNGIAVDADAVPFERACAQASDGAAGAGDVFWSRATDRLSLAVVLEPEVVASKAMHMLFVAMVAFGDAFGALAPPELGLYYRWPDDLIVNGARVGGMRVGLPRDAAPDAVPDWLVVGLDVRIADDERDIDPGHDLDNTTLFEEGCGDLDRTLMAESFCRHLLVWIHTWSDEGFRPVHDMWMGRVLGKGEEVVVTVGAEEHAGTFLGLDDDGNLLLRSGDAPTRSVHVLAVAERFG